jgi:hypothetical protein
MHRPNIVTTESPKPKEKLTALLRSLSNEASPSSRKLSRLSSRGSSRDEIDDPLPADAEDVEDTHSYVSTGLRQQSAAEEESCLEMGSEQIDRLRKNAEAAGIGVAYI